MALQPPGADSTYATNLDGTVSGEAIKSISGTAPVEIDSTNNQTPVISVDETQSADDPNDLTSDTTLMSELAIDSAFRQRVGTAPATGNKVGQIQDRQHRNTAGCVLVERQCTGLRWSPRGRRVTRGILAQHQGLRRILLPRSQKHSAEGRR